MPIIPEGICSVPEEGEESVAAFPTLVKARLRDESALPSADYGNLAFSLRDVDLCIKHPCHLLDESTVWLLLTGCNPVRYAAPNAIQLIRIRPCATEAQFFFMRYTHEEVSRPLPVRTIVPYSQTQVYAAPPFITFSTAS